MSNTGYCMYNVSTPTARYDSAEYGTCSCRVCVVEYLNSWHTPDCSLMMALFAGVRRSSQRLSSLRSCPSRGNGRSVSCSHRIASHHKNTSSYQHTYHICKRSTYLCRCITLSQGRYVRRDGKGTYQRVISSVYDTRFVCVCVT